MVKQKPNSLILDKRPSFFKIIFADHPTEHLRIPPDFVKYISEEVSNKVTLKGHCGGNWPIKVVKNADGMYFLQDGWKEFVRENSLGDNEFLVFRYDGNMCFNVKIFDKSGCKRVDVPVAGTLQESTGKKRRGRVGRPRKNPVGPLQLLRSTPCETDQHLPYCKSENLEKIEGKGIGMKIETGERELPFVEFDDTQRKYKSEAKETDSGSKRRLRRKRSLDERVRLGVWKNFVSFTSKFPYFKRFLEDYNAERVFILTLPKSFSEKHLPRSKLKIVLQNPEGRAWVVNTTLSGARCSHVFSGGWCTFVRDNLLKSGDGCIFELVDRQEMKVHFFRSE